MLLVILISQHYYCLGKIEDPNVTLQTFFQVWLRSLSYGTCTACSEPEVFAITTELSFLGGLFIVETPNVITPTYPTNLYISSHKLKVFTIHHICIYTPLINSCFFVS